MSTLKLLLGLVFLYPISILAAVWLGSWIATKPSQCKQQKPIDCTAP